VDNNYLDLGMNKSGFIHTLPSGRLTHQHHTMLLLFNGNQPRLFLNAVFSCRTH
jgi:hypothetical protein